MIRLLSPRDDMGLGCDMDGMVFSPGSREWYWILTIFGLIQLSSNYIYTISILPSYRYLQLHHSNRSMLLRSLCTPYSVNLGIQVVCFYRFALILRL